MTLVYSQENKQVKPGIDNARFEINEWQYGSAIKQNPGYSEFFICNLSANPEKRQKRNYSAKGIRETSRKFIDPEYFHRNHLHPDEQGWLFPERNEIYFHGQVIVTDNHFPGGFGKINFIPVE
jgi:hypothetical protein